MDFHCSHCSDLLDKDLSIEKNQFKMKWVVVLNFAMMLGELVIGYRSGSMALVAEGWHLASHVAVLSISLSVYGLAKSPRVTRQLSFGPGKLLALGGYTGAVILGLMGLFVLFQSLEREVSPVPIEFATALWVATVGLAVNLAGALILWTDHSHDHGCHNDHDYDHDHDHGHGREGGHSHSHNHRNGAAGQDHNIRSAFLHIAADAVTSVLAIFALSLGRYFHWNFLDPLIGAVGAIVVLSWAYRLCRDAGSELLDRHAPGVDRRRLFSRIETEKTKIVDFHVWRIAPRALACELVVRTNSPPKGSHHYRTLLQEEFCIGHAVIEEQWLA